MPISSIETREIEEYLTGIQVPGESLLFQAKMALNPDLADNVIWQGKTYSLVRLYGRKQVREELSEVQECLFNSSYYLSFRNKIFALFSR